MERLASILVLSALLVGCQNTQPELSLIEQSSTSSATGGKWGRVTLGAGTAAQSTTNFKVQSRVNLTPPSATGTTTNYKVKGTVIF